MRRSFCGFLISGLLFGAGTLAGQTARLSVDDLYQDLSLSPPELGVYLFLSHVGRVQFTKPKDRVLILEQAFSQAAQSKSGHFPIESTWYHTDTLAGFTANAFRLELNQLSLQTQILERLAETNPIEAAERFLEIPLPADLVFPCKLQRIHDFKPYYVAAAQFTKKAKDPVLFAQTLAQRLGSSGQILPFLEYVESISIPAEERLGLVQILLGRLPLLRLDPRHFYRYNQPIAKRLRASLSEDQYRVFLGVVDGWLRQPWCQTTNRARLHDEPRQIETWKALNPNPTPDQKPLGAEEIRLDSMANEDPEFWADAESRALLSARQDLNDRSDFASPAGLWAERFRKTLRKILEARKPDGTPANLWYLQKSHLIVGLSLLRNRDAVFEILNPKAAKAEKPDGQPAVIDEMQTHEALLQLMASEEGEAVKQQNPALWLRDFSNMSRHIRLARPELQQRFVDLIHKTNPNSPALLPYFESLKN
jgi:hypothetical protein